MYKYCVYVHPGISARYMWRIEHQKSLVAYCDSKQQADRIKTKLMNELQLPAYYVTVIPKHFVFDNGKWFQRMATSISSDPAFFEKPIDSSYQHVVYDLPEYQDLSNDIF